jgi:assimilatory nitrate reductase catalytic subunit
MASEGFLVSRQRIALPEWLQHTRITIPGGEALVFASTQSPEAIHGLLINHLGEAWQRAELSDPFAGDFRTLAFAGERLSAALFVQTRRDPVALDWLIESLGKDTLSPAEHKAVVAGLTPAGSIDQGPLICSCFAVRRATIAAAVHDGAVTLEAIGDRLKAGTNCGSCRPEIKRVISDERAVVPEMSVA